MILKPIAFLGLIVLGAMATIASAQHAPTYGLRQPSR